MEVSTVSELYNKVSKYLTVVFVVPLIGYDLPKTNYLYLLYKDILNSSASPEIKDLSVFQHIRIIPKILFNKNCLLHYHWLEIQDLKSLFGMPYKLLCIWMFKVFGGPVVWTVHNLKPHNERFENLNKRIHLWMADKADIIHIHSAVSKVEVEQYLDISDDKIAILKHPLFPADISDSEDAKRQLLNKYITHKKELSNPVFLMPGAVSSYKGYTEVCEKLTQKEYDFTLIIAGFLKKGEQSLHNDLVRLSEQDERIIYIPKFIQDDDFALFMNAADFCIYNYDEILTSGSVEMALSYSKKVIAPSKGDLRQYSDHQFVTLFDSSDELEKILLTTLKEMNNG